MYKDDCDQDDKSQFRDNLLQVPGVKQLQDFLTQCMQDAENGSEDPIHKNNAQDGEVTAIYAWLLNHKG